tara:strand:- start:1148 stop:1546 length:399 start_codon:yes stop_codon:yes gene_type:complete
MKVIGLDGKDYKWNPKSGGGKRSKLHKKAKEALDTWYPYDRILEEVSLPGTKTSVRKSILRADLYVPNRNLIVEVHGEQHFKFNKFHYKDKLSFFRAQARDRDKVEWCTLNDIKIVQFKHNETLEEWKSKIE